MLYENIEILDAKDRDMLIMSNLSDVQEMLMRKQYRDARHRINAIKTMMIKTKELIASEVITPVEVKKQKAQAMGEWGGTDRFLPCNE